eukprot:m.17807 g.17807  ORF g.17807 m.17807 type:complete len:291 (+) comp6116_c0_seq2:73-945(+)
MLRNTLRCASHIHRISPLKKCHFNTHTPAITASSSFFKRAALVGAGSGVMCGLLATNYANTEEEPVSFNKEHYKDGLNGRFMVDEAVDVFAGGEAGGGGRFENPETRDIAGALLQIAVMLIKQGLRMDDTIIDVGAGTGLTLGTLSKSVGSGNVVAIDISQVFVDYMQRRVKKEGLTNVTVKQCSDKDCNVSPGTAKFAFICDVYHHFEYPITFMRSLHSALQPGGKVVVIDFHKDPEKMVHHSKAWAIEHLRAGQDVFRKEIESAGFKLVAEPVIPELLENYVMVFEKQ